MKRPSFPGYGRELMQRRLAGVHPKPDHLFLVAVGFWPWLGEGAHQWPRDYAMVVLDSMPLALLELRMLAGLSPLVVCDRARRARAADLVELIQKVEPLRGAVFLLDVEAEDFLELSGRGLLDRTAETDYWKPLAASLLPAVRRSQEHDRTAA